MVRLPCPNCLKFVTRHGHKGYYKCHNCGLTYNLTDSGLKPCTRHNKRIPHEKEVKEFMTMDEYEELVG